MAKLGVKNRFALLASLSTVFMFAQMPLWQAWGDTVIDPFDTIQTIQSSAPTSGWIAWNSVSGGDIWGGNRDMRLDETAGDEGALFMVQASTGVFSLTQGPSVEGRSETRWDGMTAVDLTEGGTVHALILTGILTDHDASILLTVNGTSTHTVSLPVANSPWALMIIPFSSFSNPAAFQSVNSITMLIPATGSSSELDLSMDEIGTLAYAADFYVIPVKKCCTCKGTLNGTRWCDNGDGTITDLTTCLVWLQKADWGGEKVWQDCSTHDDAHTRAGLLYAGDIEANLSDGSEPGDWRLPTKTELSGLANGPEAVRFGDAKAFTGVKSEWYWSSTTYAATTSEAWGVGLVMGNDFNASKALWESYVWPVRGIR